MRESDQDLTILPVRQRTTEIGGGETETERMVFCPLQNHAVPLEGCLACERYAGVAVDEEVGTLACRLPAEVRGAPPCMAARDPLLHDLLESTPAITVAQPNVTCVDPYVSASELALLFGRHGVQALPVVDEDGELLGMVEAGALLAETDWLSLTVGRLMTTPAARLSDRASIADALVLLREKKLRCLPLISATDDVVGVLTADDVLRWLAKIGR
jgi:CBS domain-containing protein